MRQWIENRRVLAGFSDPAGAKAILALLYLYSNSAQSVIIISDRQHSFYREFGFRVFMVDKHLTSHWLQGIDIVITGTSYPGRLELNLIDEATKVGIPTVSFIDHWINMALRFEREGQMILPDVIGVIDERAQAIAEDEGLPTEKLQITGNPHHEYLRQWQPPVSRTELLLPLGIEPQKPFLLYAPEPFSSFALKSYYGFDEIDGLELIFSVKQLLQKMSFTTVIKGHPNQDHTFFQRKLEEQGDSTTIYLSKGNFISLCYYCTAVIGFFSNALIEAEILSKPVIRPLSLLQNRELDSLKPNSENSFLDAYSERELTDYIRKTLNSTE